MIHCENFMAADIGHRLLMIDQRDEHSRGGLIHQSNERVMLKSSEFDFNSISILKPAPPHLYSCHRTTTVITLLLYIRIPVDTYNLRSNILLFANHKILERTVTRFPNQNLTSNSLSPDGNAIFMVAHL